MRNANVIQRWIGYGAVGILAAMASATSATDFAPIDVTMDIAELSVSHEETVLRNQAVMALANGEEGAVRCSATFRNGPEKPVERKVVLQPGDEKVVSAPIRRTVTRLQIEVSCREVE